MMKDSGPKNAKSVQYLRAKSARISRYIYFAYYIIQAIYSNKLTHSVLNANGAKSIKRIRFFFHIDVMILKIEAMKKKC